MTIIVEMFQSAGNPVLHLHCGVTSQGPVLVSNEGLYHSVSAVGFANITLALPLSAGMMTMLVSFFRLWSALHC